RLRFINGAANTFYDVRIPGLELTVVQADGVNVEPVTVDEFRFGPGGTYDVLVQPKDDAHTIFAQAMDRSGYARGTLGTHGGREAAVPAVDPVECLCLGVMMRAVGCGKGGMRHGAGLGLGARAGMGDGDRPGMDHGSMQGMNHAGMDQG